MNKTVFLISILLFIGCKNRSDEQYKKDLIRITDSINNAHEIEKKQAESKKEQALLEEENKKKQEVLNCENKFTQFKKAFENFQGAGNYKDERIDGEQLIKTGFNATNIFIYKIYEIRIQFNGYANIINMTIHSDDDKQLTISTPNDNRYFKMLYNMSVTLKDYLSCKYNKNVEIICLTPSGLGYKSMSQNEINELLN